MQEQRGQVPEEGDVEREQAYHIAQVGGRVHSWANVPGDAWFGRRQSPLWHLPHSNPTTIVLLTDTERRLDGC